MSETGPTPLRRWTPARVACALIPPAVSAGLLWTLARLAWTSSPGPAPDVVAVAYGVALSLAVNNVFAPARLRASARACGLAVPVNGLTALWNGLLPLTFYAPLNSGVVLQVIGVGRITGAGWRRAAACVALDGVLSLASLACLVGVAVTLHPGVPGALRVLALSAALAVVALVPATPRLVARVARIAPRLGARVRALLPDASPRALGSAFALALVVQCSEVWLLWIAARAVGLGLDLRAAWSFGPMSQLAAHIPLSVNGFGVREVVLQLVAPPHLDRTALLTAGVLTGVLEFVAPALAGLPWAPYALRALRASDRPLAAADAAT